MRAERTRDEGVRSVGVRGEGVRGDEEGWRWRKEVEGDG